MQERVVDLIGKLDHDELTAELLHVNDEMNNLSLRYSRFTKNSTALSPSALVAQAIGTGGNKKMDAKDSLIDLSDDEGEAAAAPVNLLERRVGDMSKYISNHPNSQMCFMNSGIKGNIFEKQSLKALLKHFSCKYFC